MTVTELVKRNFMKNMKYETFLFYIRQPFVPHQRKIVFYEEESDYVLSKVAFTHLYHRYKTGAKYNKRNFNLTKRQFKRLTSSRCFYCGIVPHRLFNRTGYNASRKPYVYNGVDRVNSKEGYIISNCVSCCFACNRMKNTLDSDIFIKKSKEIYRYQKSKTKRKR